VLRFFLGIKNYKVSLFRVFFRFWILKIFVRFSSLWRVAQSRSVSSA
jgi:hypothetical protein